MRAMDDDSSKLDDEDRALFRAAVADARPLPEGQAMVRRQRRPLPRARFTHADEARVLGDSMDDVVDYAEIGTGEELQFAQAPVTRAMQRRLRRGQYSVAGEIDLHGLTTTEARAAMGEFLAECRELDRRCVRIVHGKGRGSGNRGPVLKSWLNAWLQRRREVLAFCSARPVDGGTGAVYVLLDTRR